MSSTALVQRNETLAHERIQATFHNFSETISAYGGNTREIRGDAQVAEFERASDAVAAAIAFQSVASDPDPVQADNIQPILRIGISLGEVVIADNTVTGAGVVLAQLGRMDEAREAVAKLQELAPDLSVSRLRDRWPLRDQDSLNMMLDGLRAAGLPE